ncbi:MAG: AbrB/MazE/SpoVT family DNA-binding domain-containing protein, partial [Gemmatimonadota bacterium]
HKIRLRKIGGSIGTTFPKDVTDSLNVQPGDTLNVVRTERGILLTPYDPVFEAGMRAYERVNKQYRNALRELSSK